MATGRSNGDEKPDQTWVVVPVSLHFCFHQTILQVGSEGRLKLTLNPDKATLTSVVAWSREG